MGKVKFSFAVSEVRNKVGDTVYSRNRYGAYTRAYKQNDNNMTPAQTVVRTMFGTLSAAWKALTNDQRNQWQSAAAALKKRDVFAQQYSSNGFQFYMQLNMELLTIGNSPLVTPPANFPMPSFSNVTATFTHSSNHFDFNIGEFNLTTDQSIVIRATPAESQGATFFKNKLGIIGYNFFVDDLPFNLYSDYILKYGSFTDGSRIGWQVYAIDINTGLKSQVFNGYTDINFSGYDPDAAAYFAQLSTQPSSGMKDIYNNLFISLKAGSNNFSKLDRLRIYATEIEDNGWVSLVNPTSAPAVVNGTPSWTQYQGYVNSGTDHIDTNFNPLTDGINYTLNLASTGAYSRTNTSNSFAIKGSVDGFTKSLLQYLKISGSTYVYINETTSASQSVSDSLALITGKRINSTQVDIYKRGTNLGTFTDAVVGVPGYNVYDLCRNSSGTAQDFDTRQLAISFEGGDINVPELYSSLQQYMSDIGTQV